MTTLAKVGIVAGGYLAAGLIAASAVAVHVASTANDSRGADGMYAFGDLLLFLCVFALIALVPTGVAIYFVRVRKAGHPNNTGMSPN